MGRYTLYMAERGASQEKVVEVQASGGKAIDQR